MLYHNWQLKSKKLVTKENLLNILAQNRNLKSKKETDDFLNPNLTPFFNLKLLEIPKAIDRIDRAINHKEKIIVYSDYDADGICGTAVLWETLKSFGADVLPYVPDRITEGYGLNIEAIKALAADNVGLIITVDHGVTARKQIELAENLGVDVILTDHHTIPVNKPAPHAFVHTTDLSGAGVAFKLAYEFAKSRKKENYVLDKLDLVALATIADLVPLNGFNRGLVKFGLEQINKTKRIGLQVLIENASLTSGEIDAWHVGFVIAPKINAAGRLENAVESLRLLCTQKSTHAQYLAKKILQTNNKRQELTVQAIEEARALINHDGLIGLAASNRWHEGVIGLVAAKLVEEFYRPTIIISRGSHISKGSARSVAGFNIIEAIRKCSDLLIDAGGHPMAAGFIIKTSQIEVFCERISEIVSQKLDGRLLSKNLPIDGVTQPTEIDLEFFELVEKFKPFGIGNPEPVFLAKNVSVDDVYGVGAANQHLKLHLGNLTAIGFGLGGKRVELRPADQINLVFTLVKNSWNGTAKIELKIKDFANI